MTAARTGSRLTLWIAVIAWALVIFGFSALPGTAVPGRFGNLAHFAEYAVLGALLFSALRVDRPIWRSLIAAVILASLYAVTDEVHQSFVPMRVPDPRDWVLDTAGALAGALVALALERARGRLAKR